MKKTLMPILAAILILSCLLSLCACKNKSEGNSDNTTVQGDAETSHTQNSTGGSQDSSSEENGTADSSGQGAAPDTGIGTDDTAPSQGGSTNSGGNDPAETDPTVTNPSETGTGNANPSETGTGNANPSESGSFETSSPDTPEIPLTAAQVYYNAFKNLEAQGSYAVKVDTMTKFVSPSSNMTMPAKMEATISGYNTDELRIRMKTEVTMAGQLIKSDVYSEGGWLYYTEEHGNRKVQADPNDPPRGYSVAVYLRIHDLQVVAALQYGTMTEDSNGNYVLTATLENEKIDEAFGQRSDMLLGVTLLKLDFVIDKNNNFISAECHTVASGSSTVVGSTQNTVDIHVDYTQIGGVTVEAPEGYRDYK